MNEWDEVNRWVARQLASEGTEMTPDEVSDARREIYRKLREHMAARGYEMPAGDQELHEWIMKYMAPEYRRRKGPWITVVDYKDRPPEITQEDLDAALANPDSLPELADEERRIMEERAGEIWKRIQEKLDEGK